MKTTDVLVIGGGAAGLAAATRLRSASPGTSVTLANPSDANVYRPWLMYTLRGRMPEDNLRLALPDLAARHGFTFRQAEVSKIDVTGRTASFNDSTLQYRYLIIAAGAPTDRNRIPGAAQNAIFPCDVTDYQVLRDHDASDSTVTFLLTGERISPGLEEASWLARPADTTRKPGPHVRVVADGDCVLDQFGRAATRRMQDLFASWRAELIIGTRIEGVTAGSVALADGRSLASDVIAVVGPLRGPQLALDGNLTDEHGFFPVDASLRSCHDEYVYVAGDAIEQGQHTWRKNWQLSARQATMAADNVLRAMNGQPPREFSGRKDARLSAFSLPDIGGTALLVRNRRLLLAGSRARQIRFGMDKKHFKAYLPGSQPWQHLPR